MVQIDAKSGAPVPPPPPPVKTPSPRVEPFVTPRPAADVFEAAPAPTPFATPARPPTPTPAPTVGSPVTPAVAVPAGPVYWGGLAEAQLSAFQQEQATERNDCADYTIAAAMNMLYGGAAQGKDVARAADLGNVLFGYRLWPNGPTTPAQHANLVNDIARQGGLPVSATALRATPAELVGLLQQPDTVVVVTIGWDDAHVPEIARASDAATRASGGAALQINAHAMVLAAFDPGHRDANGNPAPWGFVNSWSNGGSELYWMPDADFQQAWAHDIPLVGAHNAVVITRTAATGGSATATATPTPSPNATPTPTPPRPGA